MKKLILALAVGLLLAACGGQKKLSEKEIEQEIRDRVASFYTIVNDNHWSEDERVCDNWSSELNEAYGHAFDKSKEDGDEVPPVDYDPWLQCQDSENPYVDIANIKIESQEKAVVSVVIHNMGYTTKLDLQLVKENGRWMADDFITEPDDNRVSLKKTLKDF